MRQRAQRKVDDRDELLELSGCRGLVVGHARECEQVPPEIVAVGQIVGRSRLQKHQIRSIVGAEFDRCLDGGQPVDFRTVCDG